MYSAGRFSVKRILVLEDNANLAELYREEFEEDGYEVLIANSGSAARSILERSLPDLAIVDPHACQDLGEDGAAALKMMSPWTQEVPLIINSDPAFLGRCSLKRALTTFVCKSSDLTELKTKVLEKLGAGAVRTSAKRLECIPKTLPRTHFAAF